ncbi:putative type-1 restriction enzyme MjaXP specificity protein [Marine Group I thaumarchaeote SCGC AAA799-P11]|uniref:Putative type-1 restriction enzyme MjaXP specificity protein n=1 Tax=Marine Group I thaumarchaeote SCGC AAA799-P11 TaxID=1502295 RepID=A0A087S118_9ARCH|nr:putative type-1 restriction enzyme MjaXP specificity protein [Marine Group I thaumarchaeote SCGC AAA799-P11]
MSLKKGYKSVPWLFGKEIEIPEEWEVKCLNETGDLINGLNKDKEDYGHGCLHVNINNIFESFSIIPERLGRVNATEKEIDTYALQKGDICLLRSSVKREGVGYPALFNEDNNSIVFSGFIIRFRPNKIWFSIYLTFLLRSELMRNIIVSKSSSSANTNINQKSLGSILIIIPPLSEQQKIATILSNVDNLIESTEMVITNSKKVKKGLMQKLLTRGIGHKKFKNTYLKYRFLKISIPEENVIKNVKQISTLDNNAVKTGPFGLMLHSSDYVSQGTPLILVKNIQRGHIVDSDIPKISEKDVERLSDYRVKEDDVIFTRVGRVGSSALVKKTQVGWLFSGQTLRIRFENPELNIKYVNYYFQSELFTRLLIPELLGSTRDSINTKILEEIPIILPSKNEQDKIVIILSNIDSKIESQEKYKEKLERLKKSLMQKLLTGEVRVAI